MASGLYMLIFEAVYGSRTLSLLLCTLDSTERAFVAGIDIISFDSCFFFALLFLLLDCFCPGYILFAH